MRCLVGAVKCKHMRNGTDLLSRLLNDMMSSVEVDIFNL